MYLTAREAKEVSAAEAEDTAQDSRGIEVRAVAVASAGPTYATKEETPAPGLGRCHKTALSEAAARELGDPQRGFSFG